MGLGPFIIANMKGDKMNLYLSLMEIENFCSVESLNKGLLQNQGTQNKGLHCTCIRHVCRHLPSAWKFR